MPVIPLTQPATKALNRKILAAQCLSEKASGPRSVVRVAEACCGVNAQDFLESFSSFWARVDGFRDQDLLSELKPKGGLVRTWTVRSTMHIIPAKDYWVHIFGGPGRRFQPWFDRTAKQRGIGDWDYRLRSLYQPLLDHIKGRAVTSNEVKEFMVERLHQLGLQGKMKLRRGWSSVPTYGPSWSGLSEMSYHGLLVNAGRTGSQSLWMGSADWLGRTHKLPDSDECLVQLVRKYTENYGPVTRQDIVYWSFLLKRDVDRALEALKKDLIVETFKSKEEYFMYDSFLDAGEPPEVIILPEFDTLMMGYREKSRVLPRDRVKNVFWGLGGISRTILVDGFVAGIWKRKKRGREMTVTITPLRTLRAREKGAIIEEFSRYADYLQTKISVEFHPSN